MDLTTTMWTEQCLTGLDGYQVVFREYRERGQSLPLPKLPPTPPGYNRFYVRLECQEYQVYGLVIDRMVFMEPPFIPFPDRVL